MMGTIKKKSGDRYEERKIIMNKTKLWFNREQTIIENELKFVGIPWSELDSDTRDKLLWGRVDLDMLCPYKRLYENREFSCPKMYLLDDETKASLNRRKLFIKPREYDTTTTTLEDTKYYWLNIMTNDIDNIF